MEREKKNSIKKATMFRFRFISVQQVLIILGHWNYYSTRNTIFMPKKCEDVSKQGNIINKAVKIPCIVNETKKSLLSLMKNKDDDHEGSTVGKDNPQ